MMIDGGSLAVHQALSPHYLTSKNMTNALLTQANAQAQARVIQANAEAEALQTINASVQGRPELLQYQYINKLSPGIQVMLVPNSSPYLLPLPTLTPTETTVP